MTRWVRVIDIDIGDLCVGVVKGTCVRVVGDTGIGVGEAMWTSLVVKLEGDVIEILCVGRVCVENVGDIIVRFIRITFVLVHGVFTVVIYDA